LARILKIKKEMRVKANFQSELQLKQSVGARRKVMKDTIVAMVKMIVWVLLLGWFIIKSLRKGKVTN
jgi:hypothetical protein